MDRASHQMGAGVSLQVKAPIGERVEQARRQDFPASNNEIDYETILAGIDLTSQYNQRNSSYAVTLNW